MEKTAGGPSFRHSARHAERAATPGKTADISDNLYPPEFRKFRKVSGISSLIITVKIDKMGERWVE